MEQKKTAAKKSAKKIVLLIVAAVLVVGIAALVIYANCFGSCPNTSDFRDAYIIKGITESLATTHTIVGQNMPSKRHQRIAQEVMGEYLKYLEPTQEQMIAMADYFIAPIAKLNKLS